MAQRDLGNGAFLATAGKQTNPGDQTVHADTGVLIAAGSGRSKLFEVTLSLGGSVAAIWQVQRRNAANAANIAPSPYTFYTLAGESTVFWFTTPIDPGERIRVTNDGAITGTTAAVLMAEVMT